MKCVNCSSDEYCASCVDVFEPFKDMARYLFDDFMQTINDNTDLREERPEVLSCLEKLISEEKAKLK